MRLLTYLREEKIEDDAFAARLGACTGHAVKKWKYGERSPDAGTIARIEAETGGRVALADWVEQETERRARRAPANAPAPAETAGAAA